MAMSCIEPPAYYGLREFTCYITAYMSCGDFALEMRKDPASVAAVGYIEINFGFRVRHPELCGMWRKA